MNGVDISPITEKINVFLGLLVAILSYVFGANWFLFVGFLVLNVVDYITGTMKAHLAGKSNSTKGFKGLLKKIGYWLMIMVAFSMSAVFIELGMVIHIDLSITSMIGWFTLASLIINELRSIIENFVEIYGDKVPKILRKGLEVAGEAIEKVSELDDDQNTSL